MLEGFHLKSIEIDLIFRVLLLRTYFSIIIFNLTKKNPLDLKIFSENVLEIRCCVLAQNLPLNVAPSLQHSFLHKTSNFSNALHPSPCIYMTVQLCFHYIAIPRISFHTINRCYWHSPYLFRSLNHNMDSMLWIARI